MALIVVGAATWLVLATALALALLGVLPRTRPVSARFAQRMLVTGLLFSTCALLTTVGDMAEWPRQIMGTVGFLEGITGIVLAVILFRYGRQLRQLSRPASGSSGEPGWPTSS
ncbi:MAG: hypothetical protein ACYCPF_18020 [Streptosporangiaceae bacterium]